jgi:iron(III) transport system substrate-binding protein
MKTFGKIFTIIFLVSLLAGCSTPAPAVTEAPPEQGAPAATEASVVEPTLTAQQEWLKANQLGDFATGPQDWAAIEEAAKKEGKVVVYANTSKIESACKAFNEKYPGVTCEGYDLNGDDVLSKTLGEQESGNPVGDIWFSSGGADLVGNVLPKGYVQRFVPDTITTIPEELTKPLLISRFGTTIVAYNKELNKECPIKNLWELTQPEWKGKVVLEDPINNASTLSKLLTFVYHADEMKQAYVDLYGKEPVLDADTPDAGWLWLKKFAQNAPIPQPGGDEVDTAFATPGMKDNYLGLTSYSNYTDVIDGNLAFEPCWGLDPISGVQSQSYVGIMNQAPHPNAAKLFTQYIVGAEGRDPWAKFGTYFADTTFQTPEGMKTLDEIRKLTWLIEEKYSYDNMVQARDFYLTNLGTP